jgi:hypothetical protein
MGQDLAEKELLPATLLRGVQVLQLATSASTEERARGLTPVGRWLQDANQTAFVVRAVGADDPDLHLVAGRGQRDEKDLAVAPGDAHPPMGQGRYLHLGIHGSDPGLLEQART